MASAIVGESFAGDWWIAGNEDHRVHAKLTVDADRAELRTAGTVPAGWFGEHSNASGMVVRVRAVHGTVGGIDFTLLECDVPIESEADVQIGFDAEAVVRGVHIADADEARFDGVAVRIQNLSAYAGPSGLRLGQDGTVISPVRDPVKADVGDGTSASLVWTMSSGSRWTADGHVRTVEESAHVDVRFDKLLSVNGVRRVVRRLQDLVTFVTGVGSLPTLRTLMGPARSTSDDAELTGERLTAELTEMSTFAPSPWQGQPTRPLLKASEIPWPDLAPGWFALYDDFRPILGTLLGQRYLAAQFVENRALHAVIAAEQIYRALKLPDTFLSATRLSTARKAIRKAVAAAPEETRATVEPHLAQLLDQLHNRVTLDDRLRGVVNHVGPPAEQLMGGTVGIGWWIIAARQSRNDLGHTGHTARYGVSALGTIARATEALFELALAKQLGADEALLLTIVDRRHWRIAGQVSGLLQPSGPDTAPAS